LLAEIDALVGRASILPIMMTRTAGGQSLPAATFERIGKFGSYLQNRTVAELLIDCEEAGRFGVLVDMPV